ncbi:MAG: hypothetical protein AB1610_08075 [Nitrospirota bacterium]
MKLGELLVREGLITKEQLAEALDRQVRLGGKIGTNLVELRVLPEEELLKSLSRFYKVPAVPAEKITSIPEDVLNLIDVKLIEKYQILPFDKERKRLYVAMMNPTDIMQIDELRFITGYEIVPYVITEIRLFYALEKYYGIKRELRYVSLTTPFNPETVEEVEISVDKVKAAFAEIKDREEIAGILINETHKIANRVALFIVKGNKIAGWKARGITVEGFAVTGEEIPLFSEVLRTKNYYRGPVLNIKGNEPFIRILSGTPQDALLMPIALRDRLVAFIYVDNGNASVLNANISYLSKLTSMAALAFEIIILRNKILEM